MAVACLSSQAKPFRLILRHEGTSFGVSHAESFGFRYERQIYDARRSNVARALTEVKKKQINRFLTGMLRPLPIPSLLSSHGPHKPDE